jgi:SAM-dependent methyltransferase
MTTLADEMDDRALKGKHRTMWAAGDYAAVASEIIPDLGRILVEASGVTGAQRVLDVAAGTGNAAIPAALTGARVTATDLAPELLEAGRALSERRGATVEWREADAEALPFADGEFDTVLSCVGVMFTPHHRASADELVRVCRPGGTIGLANWTASGFVGQMFDTMKPFNPPPPPGTQPPVLWGDADYVRTLLGERVTDVVVRRQTVRVDRFATAEQFVGYFKASYGPTIAAYRNIADDAERTASLDRELSDLARRHAVTPSSAAMDWEYLLLTARTR